MNRKVTILSTLALICITATGCVSAGGSYVRYDSGPRNDRIDRDRRPPSFDDRRSRDDRWNRDRRPDQDRGGRPGNNHWDNDRRDRARGERPPSTRPQEQRDGRWIMRDGRRIFVPARG